MLHHSPQVLKQSDDDIANPPENCGAGARGTRRDEFLLMMELQAIVMAEFPFEYQDNMAWVFDAEVAKWQVDDPNVQEVSWLFLNAQIGCNRMQSITV